MKDVQVFEIALGLKKPWYIESIELDADRNRLDIRVDFTKGAKFSCPSCGTENRCVHDTAERTWRHLDFFQFETYVTARVPRVKCGTCGVHQVCVPWAREGSGFTLLFERRIIDLAPVMPIKTFPVSLVLASMKRPAAVDMTMSPSLWTLTRGTSYSRRMGRILRWWPAFERF